MTSIKRWHSAKISNQAETADRHTHVWSLTQQDAWQDRKARCRRPPLPLLLLVMAEAGSSLSDHPHRAVSSLRTRHVHQILSPSWPWEREGYPPPWGDLRTNTRHRMAGRVPPPKESGGLQTHTCPCIDTREDNEEISPKRSQPAPGERKDTVPEGTRMDVDFSVYPALWSFL